MQWKRKLSLSKKAKPFPTRGESSPLRAANAARLFQQSKAAPIKGAAFVLLDGATRIFAGWKAGF